MALGNHKVEIVVGVKDLASRALGNISRNVQNMSKHISNSGSGFGALNRMLDGSIGKLDKMASSMMRFNMYTSDLQRNLRNVAAMGVIGAGAVAYTGMDKTLQFDYKTHQMQSRMETSPQVRKQLEDYILNDLNLKVSFNPLELADMGITLGQGGISNAADMKSMMKTTSYFSEAVDAVPDVAAEMIIAASKGFGIAMDKSQDITDKLTVALNKSLLSVEEMPHAIGELAGRANMFGQSFDSSLVALMTMRDAGMSAAQGSQDFLHGLRQASRIGNDDVLFERTMGYFTKLGITDGIFNKDTRKLKEFPDLISDIEKAMVKSGFTNPKYNVKSQEDYYKLLEKNKGVMPQDFWDSMKAMPLITRVFGAAGQAPILMGLQSQYEELDADGNKTGKVYYGSEAIKRRYKDVKDSDGAVNNAHNIMADSPQFQIDVLKGAWDAAQVKFLGNMLPVLKTGAESVTNWLNPGNKKNPMPYDPSKPSPINGGDAPATGIEKFRTSIKTAADNFRNGGHKTVGDIIETTGNGVINGIQIGSVMPPVIKQIVDAFQKDFVNADWGSNIVEFPFKVVENGIKFINDIVKSNKDFQKAVEKLPENLQDPAKLVETLAKGGIVLMVTGAIVKVIELGVRGVSAGLKGAKVATTLTEMIIKMFTGGKEGKGKSIAEALGKTMAINANIVNVYGKAVNNGGDLPDGPGKKTPNGKKVPPLAPVGGIAGAAQATAVIGGVAAYTGLAAWGWSKWEGDYNGTKAKALRGEVEPGVPLKKQLSTIETKQKMTDTQVGNLQKYLKGLESGDKKGNMESVSKQVMTKFQALMAKDNKDFNKKVDANLGTIKVQVGKTNNSILNTVNKSAATLDGKTNNISSSIVSGFNTANHKLQNIKIQNHNNINVSVPAPSVHISGDIKPYLHIQKVTPVQKAYNDASATSRASGTVMTRRGTV